MHEPRLKPVGVSGSADFFDDTVGNIREVRQGGTPIGSYTYGNDNQKDLLTGFNNKPILYEGQSLVNGAIVGDPTSGNPISYFNGTRWEFTWQNGRQLASASTTDGDTTIDIDYTYDINGLRTGKTITRTTGGGTAHTHEYTSSVTAPTCTTAGFTTYTCDCGESYVDNLVDALGHNYVQSGNVYTCSRCGDSYTGHEHSYTEETTQPTCTTAGYTVYTCSCGDSYTVNIPALGHNYVLVGQSGNVATYECSRCGHRYSAVIPVDPQPPVEYSLRSSNTVTEHHEYVYASGQLMRETITTTANGTSTIEVLNFIYGSGSTPLALVYTNGTASPVTYYYVTNMQGDVVKLVTASGVTVASYAYDAWGRITTATGSMAEVNPIRYRGYYYDAEIGMYYLQSRYYDPSVRRFVNADATAITDRGFLGCNTFAYCGNNPVEYIDVAGKVYEDNEGFDVVGAGIQIGVSVGSGSMSVGGGIEIVVYWNTTECNENNELVVAIYVYGGGSICVDQFATEIELATQLLTENAAALTIDSKAVMDKILKHFALSFNLSVSGFVVWGNSVFEDASSYTEGFDTVSLNLWHVQAAYSWSDCCRTFSLGGTAKQQYGVTRSKSFYWLITDFSIALG